MTPARLRGSLSVVALSSALSILAVAASGGAAFASSGGMGATKTAGQSGAAQAGGKKGSGPTNVIDHGGAVLLHSRTVAIFWGPTADFDPQLQPAMESLLGGMGGSAYLGVVQQYMRVSSGISSTFGGSILDTSAPPKQALQPSGLAAEVAKLVATPDPSTVYFVFTSNEPHISYCAYHSDATANGVLVEVAYVPLQPSGCSPFSRGVNLDANGYDVEVSAAADSAAHEFIESVTDPHLDAWYDKNGEEVSDKCEYDYQGVVHLANHSQWQIQSTWSNAISACDPGLGR